MTGKNEIKGCRVCGGAVVDEARHRKWHRDQERPRIHWTGGAGVDMPETPPAHTIPTPPETKD